MHNGQQRRETVKGARLNLIINFYDYSGREQPRRNAHTRALAAMSADERRGARTTEGRTTKKCIRISRSELKGPIKP